MSNTKNPTSSTCFSTILHHFICSKNLSSPLHPLTQPQNPHHHHHHHHHHNSAIVARNSQAQTSQEPRKTPGVIARLMGLDSFPNPQYQNYDSLKRSKSLNSLRLFLDFDPARISANRRGRASASFHECETGHKFFATIAEYSEINRRKTEECDVGSRGLKPLQKQSKEKMVMLKEDDRIRGSRERNDVIGREKRKGGKYERGKINHLRENKIKRSVELVYNEVSSRSPASVLDHRHRHRHFGFDSRLKGDSRHVISSPGRRSSRKKFKVFDDKPSQDNVKLKFGKNNQGSNWSSGSCKYRKSMKAEMVVADYFGLVLGQVCKSVEEEIGDPKTWTRKYQVLKVGFMQELGKGFVREILDFLLDELIHEMIVN